MFEWFSVMHLLTEGWNFPPMNLHGLMHMWILGVPQHMLPTSSMHEYGMELDNFTMVKRKYNYTERIMKPAKR